MKHVTDYFRGWPPALARAGRGSGSRPAIRRRCRPMRLLTGLVVVYLHATLSFDLVALFGPDGLLPAADIAPLEARTLLVPELSFHARRTVDRAPGRPGRAGAVRGRLWTRVTSILALVVFLSDVNRAPMITSRTEADRGHGACSICASRPAAGGCRSTSCWRGAGARRAQRPTGRRRCRPGARSPRG